MADTTLRPPSRLSLKPRPPKGRPGAKVNRASRLLMGKFREAGSFGIGNPLPDDKRLVTAQSLDEAYRTRLALIEARRAVIGPVQAMTPYVKGLAEKALLQTAEFCLPLDRELCLDAHQVPFSDEELHGFELAARRAGYRSRNLLRYVPENLSWSDLSKLPVRIKFPGFESGIPQLPTIAPHPDELGVLNGCWYLHIPRMPFLSAGKTKAEQDSVLPEIARLYRAGPKSIAVGDVSDVAFLVALAAWCGDLESEPVSIVRTGTGVNAAGGFHACVLFGPTVVEVISCEDDFRAPYLGIAPAIV